MDSTPDVVQIIDDGAAPASVVSAAPAPQPAGRFELSGWSLLSGELAPSRQSPQAAQAPRDLWLSRLQLLARSRYAPSRSFEVAVSGLMSYVLAEPAATTAETAFHGRIWGDGETQLRELYVGFYGERVDLRVGQQRLAWGRAEFVSPNDVMNARDLRDPFVNETELNHLPTPMIRADVDAGWLALQLVVEPYFVPDTFTTSSRATGPPCKTGRPRTCARCWRC